jgi:hypothetical protein
MESLQWLLNISFGVLAFLGGWVFTRLFSVIDNQEKLLKDINDKTFTDFITLRKEVEELNRKSQHEISDLALKISTTYVTKESYESYFNKLESKLDRNFEYIQDFIINHKKDSSK